MIDLVAIARITKARGLSGEVKAELLTDFPERFSETVEVTAVLPNGNKRPLVLETYRFHKESVLLRFEDIKTVEDAEQLRNAEICVAEADAVELGEDEFYDWQLAGCLAVTLDGNELGLVRELMRTGGTEILVVDGKEKEYLIPFAETICVEVDIENKKILVDPPDGLLEL